MSMLTEQCSRLRSWARQFDERADFDALAPLLASDLREAADTILTLREKAQEADRWRDAFLENAGDVLALGHDNSELKSLVRDMWLNSERGRYGTCGPCRHECEYTSGGCEIEQRMAELGVEVER